MTSRLLTGADRERAADLIRRHHYTHSVPSGKSYYVGFGDAIVVWAIPANPYIGKSLLGRTGRVWELSRLWGRACSQPTDAGDQCGGGSAEATRET